MTGRTVYAVDRTDTYTSEENIFLKMVWKKAKAGNDPLQLDNTETGVRFQLLYHDPPGPPVLSFLTNTGILGMMGTEDIIIFKSQDIIRVNLTSSTGS